MAQVAFQKLGERVLPLGLGAVLIRGSGPERPEFVQLVGIEGLPGHGVHRQHRLKALVSRLPLRGHAEFRAGIRGVVQRRSR